MALLGQPNPPQAADRILRQAVEAHQSGDLRGAIRGYKAYLAQAPGDVRAISNLGAVYARAGSYPQAIEQYGKALSLDPRNLPVRLNLGLAFYKTNQLDKAAAEFASVHDAAPSELQPVLLLADCWLALGDYKKVDALITPLADQHPDDLAFAYLLGTALVRDNQVQRGQVMIDRILSHGDSAEAHLLLGATKLNQQDYPGALADLAKAVELNPALPGVYAYYAQALLRTGDPVKAEAAFRHGLSTDPNDFSANLQLGVLLREQGKNPEAETYVQRALQSRPRDLAARYEMASLNLQAGRVDLARKELESITKAAPAYTSAHVALATLYYRLHLKADGDRERTTIQKLNAETQARQQQGVNLK